MRVKAIRHGTEVRLAEGLVHATNWSERGEPRPIPRKFRVVRLTRICELGYVFVAVMQAFDDI